MDAKGGKQGGGVGGVMNWAIGIDMYTLMCIKLITNKNLLYKKINKSIKKKEKRKTGNSLVVQWLRICLPMQGTWFRSLVGELRSHMPCGN